MIDDDLEEYYCKKCEFHTIDLWKWKNHIITEKHNISVKQKVFQCECGKRYKHKSSLCRHKVKCQLDTSGCEIVEQSTTSVTLQSNNEFTNIVHTLIEENRELQNKLIEMAKEPRIIHQTNNNQKTFNIIQFLNNDCKDAMNLSDFIQNLVVTFADLEKIEEHGYLRGIKDSLVASLHNMEQTKRPIHCTDIKRKQFYVKDENEWNKDHQCGKINDALSFYNNSQLKTLLEWKQKNPHWIDNQKHQTKVNILTKEITSIYSMEGDKMKNKLLNHISEATTIDKASTQKGI
jgi:hypothetical protein